MMLEFRLAWQRRTYSKLLLPVCKVPPSFIHLSNHKSWYYFFYHLDPIRFTSFARLAKQDGRRYKYWTGGLPETLFPQNDHNGTLRDQKCTKKELLSLIGKLSFASKVVPSGRMFIRRLIDLSMTVERLSHRISLNSEARKDISWWAEYLPTWNGRYKILDPLTTPCHQLHIYTDASGEIGFGIYNNGNWVSKTIESTSEVGRIV